MAYLCSATNSNEIQKVSVHSNLVWKKKFPGKWIGHYLRTNVDDIQWRVQDHAKINQNSTNPYFTLKVRKWWWRHTNVIEMAAAD